MMMVKMEDRIISIFFAQCRSLHIYSALTSQIAFLALEAREERCMYFQQIQAVSFQQQMTYNLSTVRLVPDLESSFLISCSTLFFYQCSKMYFFELIIFAFLPLVRVITSAGNMIPQQWKQYQLSVFVTSHKLEKSFNVQFLMSQITASCLEWALLLFAYLPPGSLEVWFLQKLQPVRAGGWSCLPCLVIFGAPSGPVCGECCF